MDESVDTRQWRRQLLRRVGLFMAATLALLTLFFGARQGVLASVLFAVWLPLAAAFFWVCGLTFNVMTAFAAMLAAIPLVLALTYSLPWRALALITAASAAAMAAAGIGWPSPPHVALAVLIAT